MIRMLEESEGNVVGFQASEKLTVADYVNVLTPTLTKVVEEHGKVRVLMYFDETFEGWEPGAMWEDTKYAKHMGDFEKIAIVGGPDWVHWMTNVFKPFFRGEVRTFAGTELSEAWAWVK